MSSRPRRGGRASESARSEVVALWDERQDVCLFGLAPHLDGVTPPVVIGGRFVARDDTAGWAEWRAEVLRPPPESPGTDLLQPPVVRTFHICTRHEAAVQFSRTGRIPADFRCPLDVVGCPLRRLLDAPPNLSLEQTRPADAPSGAIEAHLGGPVR